MSNPTADILKPLEQIQRFGYTMSNVFRDWVKLMLYCLMRDDEKYLDVMGRYKNEAEMGEREADHFAEAFSVLLAKMGEDKEAGRDPREYLGDCYMEIAGKYSVQGMGQFFTPQPVCDMMADITIPEDDRDGLTVADPACGSGRLLHSAAKKLPVSAHFTGVDLDSICAHMATLNLCFFNMDGIILHGNSLAMKYYNGWIIKRTMLGGAIREMSQEHLDEYLEQRGEALKESAEQREKNPQHVNGSTTAEQEPQLTLF